MVEYADIPVKVAPAPECPEHGRMHLRVAERSPDGANVFVWVCHGFDGEGCDCQVAV